jgi:hypothetical protein
MRLGPNNGSLAGTAMLFLSYCLGRTEMMKKTLLRLAMLTLALTTVLHARADQKPMDDANCNGRPAAEQQFHPQSGDVLGPRHLELVRPFSGNGKLTFSVCHAEVHVRSNPRATELKLTVDIGSGPNGHPAADYIHVFRVDPEHGEINLKFPKDTHAVVTLIAPMHEGSHDEFNFGMGPVNFDAVGSAGHREINVGMGHINLLLDGDKDYSSMEVNIGMGSLHDHRPGGHNGHFVVSRDYSGTGKDHMEINVGMGSMDISQE